MLGWPWRSRSTVQTASAAPAGRLPASPPRPHLLPVLEADALLAKRRSAIERIEELAGVPPEHYARLYRPALQAYAQFVQQLPASEAHHHAGIGGMLDHGLEVVVNALSLRRGYLLPPGAAPELQYQLADLWTYATFAAALLHDLAKPAVDQRVTLYAADGREIGPWDAWGEPMPTGAWYAVGYRRGRSYGLHERAAPLLAPRILPAAGLSWLAGDLDVLSCLLGAIAGDDSAGGPLAELVGKADGMSVAHNLGAGGAGQRIAGGRAIPLHEKLLTALRHLIAEGRMNLNRPGAHAFRTGDELWLVCRSVIEDLREHLKAEGHSGLPSRNDRLFDELQQNGLLIPNGSKAVWATTVSCGDWQMPLTMLRMPLGRLWANPDAWPPEFDGSVTPSDEAPADEEAPPAAAATPAPRAAPARPSKPKSPAPAPTPAPEPAPVSAADDDLPLPLPFPLPPLTDFGITDTAASTAVQVRSQQDQDDDAGDGGDDDRAALDPDDPGPRFMAWLKNGLASGRIPVNAVNARVHVVQEGVVLITPAIFQDFAGQEAADWKAVQKRFQKMGLQSKRADGASSTNIHTYFVIAGKQQQKVKPFKCYLIADPRVLFGDLPVPAPNPLIAAQVQAAKDATAAI